MRNIILLPLFILISGVVAAQSQNVEQIDPTLPKADRVVTIWSDSEAPHPTSIAEQPHYQDGILTHCSEVMLYIFEADRAKATGDAVVICPGGGYYVLCMSYEGMEMAEWLASQGITAAVVQYRMPRGVREAPLEDTVAALRQLRSLAEEIGFDRERVGIMGFSAGGHLAAYTSCMAPDADKPDFTILFYPVITLEPPFTHEGSAVNLLGGAPSEELRWLYSMQNRVTSTTPPAILFHSDADDLVPTINSTLYYNALCRAGVDASLHIYPGGYHGWGIRDSFEYKQEWQRALLRWIREH